MNTLNAQSQNTDEWGALSLRQESSQSGTKPWSYMGVEGIAPWIFSFGTRSKWMVNQGKKLLLFIISCDWVGPRDSLDFLDNTKIFYPFLEPTTIPLSFGH